MIQRNEVPGQRALAAEKVLVLALSLWQTGKQRGCVGGGWGGEKGEFGYRKLLEEAVQYEQI